VHRLAVALLTLAAGATASAAGSVLDLRVVARGGTATTLREVVGDRPAVVVLWATYCPPCRAEVPAANRAAERWRSAGVRVLGLALEADLERVHQARDAWGMRYEVLTLVPGQDAAVDALLPHGLPATAFVVRDTAVLYDRVLDDAALERHVPRLLERTHAQ
jgi:thiol-disulfide isomerase/thioredoxin